MPFPEEGRRKHLPLGDLSGIRPAVGGCHSISGDPTQDISGEALQCAAVR